MQSSIFRRAPLSCLLISIIFLGSCEREYLNLPLQERLDKGVEPITIYEGDNTLLDSLYGLRYQGGIIFYLNTSTGEGMVAAEVDMDSCDWGCQWTNVTGTSQAFGTGRANTERILSICPQPGIAARLCDEYEVDGYDDWYLPSRAELAVMWENLGIFGLGDFVQHRYWTSSQFNPQFAYFQWFGTMGNTFDGFYDKEFIPYPARPIRDF